MINQAPNNKTNFSTLSAIFAIGRHRGKMIYYVHNDNEHGQQLKQQHHQFQRHRIHQSHLLRLKRPAKSEVKQVIYLLCVH